MHFFKCDDLQAWTGGKWFNLNTAKRPEIFGFSADSRSMEKNFAFAAIKAERDGHDFAADAVKNGANAIIAERELDVGVPVLVVADTLKALQRIAKMHRLRFEWPVVGITGSCGKTSTKEMLAKLVSWRNPLFTQKNFNNALGVPLTLTRIDTRMNQAAIVEAGVSAPNEMKPLAEMIEPDIAIITNVGLAHMEKFGEVGNVAREKAVLASCCAKNGWALFHHNLLSWKAFSELKCKRAVLAPVDAPEVKADLVFRYSTIDCGQTCSVEMAVEGGSDYCFEIRKMSDGMMDDALLCIAAALMLGTKEEQIAGKLAQISPLAMRGSTVEQDGVLYYLDCYNASPTSMKDALAHFAQVAKDVCPKLYLLGSMAELGLGTHRHHKEIGYNLPYSESDRALLVGESAEIYRTGMIEGGNWKTEDIEVFASAQDAKAAVEKFKKGALFAKGSRICELEKALPQSVIDAALKPCGSGDEEDDGDAQSCDEASEREEVATKKRQDEDDFEESEEFDTEDEADNKDGDISEDTESEEDERGLIDDNNDERF